MSVRTLKIWVAAFPNGQLVPGWAGWRKCEDARYDAMGWEDARAVRATLTIPKQKKPARKKGTPVK
jgi:hypothetical protein